MATLKLYKDIIKKIEYIESHSVTFAAISGLIISIVGILWNLCVKAYSTGSLDFWNLHSSYIDKGFDYINILIDIVLAILLVVGNMLGYNIFAQKKKLTLKIRDLIVLLVLLSITVITVFMLQLKVTSIFDLILDEIGIIALYSCFVSFILCIPGILTCFLTEDNKLKQRIRASLEGLACRIPFQRNKDKQPLERKPATNKFINSMIVFIAIITMYLLALHSFWSIGVLEASMQTNFKLTEDGVVILETEEKYILADYTVIGGIDSEKDIFINKERQMIKAKDDICVKILNFDDVFVLENNRYIEDIGTIAEEIIVPFEAL